MVKHIPTGTKPDAVVKNVVEIRSVKPISEETIRAVKDICKRSQCPNESMFASIPRFKSYNNNGLIIIGEGGEHSITIEY